MGKAARGERTRDDILRAGARLFALHGYYHTSTNDLLETLSLSKGAFYHHFKSKEEMARAVVAQARADYEALREQLQAEGAERGERFGRALARIVELNQSGQWNNCLLLARLAQELAQQEGDLAREVAAAVNGLMEFWREAIEEGQAAGTVRGDVEARGLAELVVAAFFGALGCRELEGKLTDLGRVAEQVWALAAKENQRSNIK